MDSDNESEHSDLNYRSLDDFVNSVSSKDTNVRLDVYARLEDYLNNENSCLKCQDLNKFCESVLQWVHSSNYRISINGLTLIQLLVQRLTEPLRNQSIAIVDSVVDRLSDSKEQVRVFFHFVLGVIFLFIFYLIKGSTVIEEYTNFHDGILFSNGKHFYRKAISCRRLL